MLQLLSEWSQWTATPHSLFKDDLRGSLAVHAEAPIRQFDDSAHGLPDRVEGVNFVELLFWELISYWLVIPLQVQDQSQKATFCLVAHLFRQTAFLICGLERGRGRDFWVFSSTFRQTFSAIHIQWYTVCCCTPHFIYFDRILFHHSFSNDQQRNSQQRLSRLQLNPS